jgi:hypothetical protein
VYFFLAALIQGKSFFAMFETDQTDYTPQDVDYVLLGQERHDVVGLLMLAIL